MAENEHVKAQLEADRKARAESDRQYAERTQGKPTPTQAENDRAKLGEHVLEHEDDGSGPDPFDKANQEARERSMGAGHPGSYQTRHSTAAQPGTARPKPTGQ